MKLMGLMLLVVGSAGFAFANIPVPELSPATGTSAITLLAGAMLVIRGRHRK
jgi:hypothetical protein